MIRVSNLVKVYKLSKRKMAALKTRNPEKTAVNGILLEVHPGEIFGHLHGMDDRRINMRKNELFGYLGIDAFKDKKIEELSTGMKQRAAIAVSLVHDPEVVIFDEPTSGLDIITARSVTNYLKKLRQDGKAIIVSTHIMSEAKKLCDRIGVIINGKKVCEGTLQEILNCTKTTDLEDAFFRLYSQYQTEEGNYFFHSLKEKYVTVE